jgi:hypothetical protein
MVAQRVSQTDTHPEDSSAPAGGLWLSLTHHGEIKIPYKTDVWSMDPKKRS